MATPAQLRRLQRSYHAALREAERRRELLRQGIEEARAQGWTFRQIGQELGVTPQRVRAILLRT